MSGFVDAAHANRALAGRAPMTTESGKSTIVRYIYSIILEDVEQTSKDIESLELHAVGDKIYDLSTGQKGKITRVSRVTERVQ